MATANQYRRHVVGVIGAALLGGAMLAACESTSVDEEGADGGGVAPDGTSPNSPGEGGNSPDGDSASPLDGALSGDGATPDASSETEAGADAAVDAAETPVDAGADAMPAVVTCTKLFGDGVARVVATGVDVDVQGNIAVVGFFTNSVDFGGGLLTSAGDDDAFLVKFDNACNHVFSKSFGSADFQVFTGVRFDPTGNILVAGTIAETIDLGLGVHTAPAGKHGSVLGKFSPSGAVQWVKFTADASAYSVDVDRDGNVYLGGSVRSGADLGGGPVAAKGVFVESFDSAGVYRWAAVASSTASPVVNSVRVIGEQVWVSGDGQGTVDFGNGPVSHPSRWGWISRYSKTGTHLGTKDLPATGPLNLGFDRSDRIHVYGGLEDIVDLGTGPLSVTDVDGGRIAPSAFLASWKTDGQSAEWVRTYGRRGASAQVVGTVSVASLPPSSRFAWNQTLEPIFPDGGRGSRVSGIPTGPIGVSPTGQFVMANRSGSPERLELKKYAP